MNFYFVIIILLAKVLEFNLSQEADSLWQLLDSDNNQKLIDLVGTYKPNRSKVREVVFAKDF